MNYIDDAVIHYTRVVGIGPPKNGQYDALCSETANLIQQPFTSLVFSFIGRAMVEKTYIRPTYPDESFNMQPNRPLVPNQIKIMPYKAGNVVRFAIETSMELPGGGRLQVTEGAFQVINLPGITEDTAIVDCDTGIAFIQPFGDDIEYIDCVSDTFELERSKVT